MVPCSLSAENIFRFFEVRTYPSIQHFGLDVSPCNAISEGRLPLCNTSSEAEALPSEVRIENDSKSIFFSKFFWKPLSPRFMVPCSLLAENIFSVFRSPHSAPTPRYTILDSRLSLVMRSRKAGFPFTTRARKREPCPQISNR